MPPKFATYSNVAKKRKAEESEENENELDMRSKLGAQSNLKFKKWLQVKKGGNQENFHYLI
jgi:hypothetical protein